MAKTSGRTSPGVHFPPPFIYAAVFMAGLASERWGRRLYVSDVAPRAALVIVGWCAIAAGIALAASGVMTFRRHRTAVIPFRPANALVRTGPYRFTRNPMYLGLATLYAGLACVFDLATPLLLLPVAIASMYLLVIRHEEDYLLDAFGDAYRKYMSEVRRWF